MTIDQTGKKMPFKEDQTYVGLLLADATDRAIRSQRSASHHLPLRRIAAILVLALTIGSTGWIYTDRQKVRQAPLDTFLDSMTEEEMAMLQDYCSDAILTYDWEWDDSDDDAR